MNIEEIKSLIKDKIQVIESSYGSTHVYAIAVAKDDCLNSYIRISGGVGNLITPGIYNCVDDTVVVRGESQIYLGEIPVSYELRWTEFDGWSHDALLPIEVVKEFMPTHKKRIFMDWLDNYKNNSIQYIQFASVY